MTDMNNKLNLNKVHNTYAQGIKKEDAKIMPKSESVNSETKIDGNKAAECYGRILVKPLNKIDNNQLVESVKESIEFFIKNPELATLAIKASDDAFDVLSAEEVENAYEETCCGILDEIYSRQ